MNINWMEEVEKRKDDLLKDLQKFLQIKSILDEENTTEEAPLGEGVKEALTYLLNLGEKDGFTAKNVDHLAGHLEFGEGDDLLGVLCHVDVVPEGDGWSVDPFGGEIKDGKIFARGAMDDKGPTIAAYYAMKIVKDLGIPLGKRVRMIIGTDEESEWRCVDHYFNVEEMPTMGFAPDADFPIIYAEKGIVDYDLVTDTNPDKTLDSDIEVLSFEAGRRYNMVPDFAQAKLAVAADHSRFVQQYASFLDSQQLKGKYYIENGDLILELEGVSAHGMEPKNGINAGLLLANFLSEADIDSDSKDYFSFINTYFYGDSRGKHLGINYEDDITGPLTINVGKIRYHYQNGGSIGLNMRYPVTFQLENAKSKIEELVKGHNLSIENFSDSKPHHVSKDHVLVKTLQKVYEEQTGDKGELLSIGGGTYARSLESGVAFGPLFPGRADVAHQKDEHMFVEDLLRATAIYAQAIAELAQE
jgi:succinyl-diaminopimelate desuccinylase